MELRDDSIVLRPWSEDDAPTVYAACQDLEIQRWIPTIPRPYTHEDARAFVTDAIGLGPHQFAIVEAGHIVGSIGLHPANHKTAHLATGAPPRHAAEASRHTRCDGSAATRSMSWDSSGSA